MKAKKHLGQNFLHDREVLEKITSFFDISGKNILEVGPGKGALTQYLLERNPQSLHLIEFDKDMVYILEEKVRNQELHTGDIDFQIFQQDILRFEPKFFNKVKNNITIGNDEKDSCVKQDGKSSMEKQNIQPSTDFSLHSKGHNTEQNYYVIANIPYYITSPILFHFGYEVPQIPDKMIIMMQKEVGERILDGDNKKKKVVSSVLSLAIVKKFHVSKVCDVSKYAFSPVPKVDSIVLAFEKHSNYTDISDKEFLDFIKLCFKEPRKKLANNLLKGGFKKEKIQEVFHICGLGENTRGEELGIEKFLDLFSIITKSS